MFGLQDLFDQQITEQFKLEVLGVRVLDAELGKIGINITDEQRSELKEELKNLNKGLFNFQFSDEQLHEANVASEEELKPKIQAIVDDLEESVKRFSEEFNSTLEEVVHNVTEEVGGRIKASLQGRMEDMIEDWQAAENDFDENIKAVWGKALDLLQGLIVISDEVAQGYLTRSDKYLKNDVIQNVLLRIHAKSRQISKEILVLLRHGFADGAQARWRSLHELAVVSSFIAHHDEDVAIKYMQHEAVEIFKSANQYNEYYAHLGTEEISNEDMSAMERDYDELVGKYGEYYRHEYGWASDALGNKKPTFRDIEAAVKLDHVRGCFKRRGDVQNHAKRRSIIRMSAR
jgi:hypothetical protein